MAEPLALKWWKNQTFCWKLKLFGHKRLHIINFNLFLCFKNIIFNFFDHTETALTSNICIYLYTNGKTMIWRHFSNSTLPGDTFGVSVLLWATVQKIFLLFFSNKPNFVHIRVSSLHIWTRCFNLKNLLHPRRPRFSPRRPMKVKIECLFWKLFSL